MTELLKCAWCSGLISPDRLVVDAESLPSKAYHELCWKEAGKTPSVLRCAECNGLLSDAQLMVESGNSYYHVACFKGNSCSNPRIVLSHTGDPPQGRPAAYRGARFARVDETPPLPHQAPKIGARAVSRERPKSSRP